MFSIGDSNACGYGLEGYYGGREQGKEAWSDGQYLNGVYGSFPQLVQEALEEDGGVKREDHICLTYPAERSKDALYFLKGDVDMTDDSFFNDIAYSTWFQVIHRDSGVEDPTIDKEVGDFFVNSLKYKEGDKKLVLLYSGISDVFFASACNAAASIYFSSGESEEIEMSDVLTKFIEELFENYKSFQTYVPKLIQRIQELNPEADIVLIGTYNPLKNLKMSEDSELPVFSATATITASMNKYYKQWAETYGCKYVDITNVETRTLEEGITISDALSSFDTLEHVYHATPEGYKYIARQILDVLKIEQSPVTYDIKVDLGSTKNVYSVKIGTEEISNYTYENSILTVPYEGTDAKLLVVSARNADGTTSMYTYQLSWSDETGYTAYATYATRDLGQSLINILKKVLNAMTKVRNSLSSVLDKIRG